MRRRTPLALTGLMLLLLAAPADARKPVLMYAGAASGPLTFYDLETGTTVTPPPGLSFTATNFNGRKVNISQSGRWLVWVAPTDKTIHLVDRNTNVALPLPGIDGAETDPASVSVTDDGRYITFDANFNPPSHIYDRTLGRLLHNPSETGIPAKAGAADDTSADMRMPQISADGRFIVGNLFGCQSGSDADVCLDAFPSPGMLTVTDTPDSEEHPCINGDGSILGLHRPTVAPDIHLLDRGSNSAGTDIPLTLAGDQTDCWLDRSGRYVGFRDTSYRIYDRVAQADLALPSGANWGPLSDAFAPPAARAPIVAYLEQGSGALRLFDTQTAQPVAAPALVVPDSNPGIVDLRVFAMSQDGRWIVWRGSDLKLHLLDRSTSSEQPLPGIDVFAASGGPDSLSVSGGVAPRIAFDQNRNGPSRVYDVASGGFVTTGLPDGHSNPQLSGDGRFLATICISACISPTVTGQDAYVQDLSRAIPEPFPADLAGTGSNEFAPCLDGVGSLMGIDQNNGGTHDIYLWSPAQKGSALTTAVLDAPGREDIRCGLDTTGHYVAFADNSYTVKLYDRFAATLVPLPAGVELPAFLTQPYSPPAPSGGSPGVDLPAAGSAPSDPPPAEPAAKTPDRAPPRITLTVARRQRILARGLGAVVSCDEPCALKLTASVGSGKNRVALGGASRKLGSGIFKVKLKVPKRKVALVRRMLRARAAVKATVAVAGTDAAGNRASARRAVAIR